MLLLFLRYYNAIVPVWFSDLNTPTLSNAITISTPYIVILLLFLRYCNAILPLCGLWASGTGRGYGICRLTEAPPVDEIL